MFAELLFATALQVGPFYQHDPENDLTAVRPFWSEQGGTTDVLWPVFTAHRDWWRFCFLVHGQTGQNDAYQFEIMPLWFNGRTREGESYAGLFPICGHHPHLALLYDIDFCLWPLWMRYRMPRPSKDAWMTTNAVLFPFFNWRDDGSWGFWPFCGVSHNRESDQCYCLWPLVNWADYREDRDTAGAGSAWMFWPFYASVERARERQWQVLPPLVSHAVTADGWRGRYPWPLVEIERRGNRRRTSVFPFYEDDTLFHYGTGETVSRSLRFGWRLVEILPDEVRVFPFFVRKVRPNSVGKVAEGYLRVWPFWEAETADGVTRRSCLAPVPIRWIDSIDRNWSKFWTLYEEVSDVAVTDHALFWGLIRWKTRNDR